MSSDYSALAYRQPYVGEGVDGTLRSLQIDREEIYGLPSPGTREWSERAEEHRAHLVRSIEAWRLQAEILAGAVEGLTVADAPSWARFGVHPETPGFEYACQRITEDGQAGDLVGVGVTSDLSEAQDDARAWLADGHAVRVIARPVAPWSPVVSA
jgi:hypothetical protein